MTAPGSVTRWIGRLKAGDHAAAQELWEHYFRRLVGLARKILNGRVRGAADEEDVALSAFASFCRSVGRDRFPQLSDRDDLWQILMVLTARKAHWQVTYENAQKRGGGRPAAAAGPGARIVAEDEAVERILSREPTPEFAAQVAEEFQRLLASLGDEQLRTVAVWKMEGYTNDEIAAKLGRGLRSIERKLQLIRRSLQLLEQSDEEEGG